MQSLYLLKTKHHFYSNIPIIRIALLTNRCTMLSNDNSMYSKLNIGVFSAWSLLGMHPGRLLPFASNRSAQTFLRVV